MQFYTAELQEIIDQLSQGGMAGGYFQTLGLIFKFLGLIIIPVLFFIVAIILFFWLPRFVVRKMITKERFKKMTDITVYRNKIRLYVLNLSKEYKFVEHVFIATSLAITIFDGILLTPFFFVSGEAHNAAAVLTAIGIAVLVICFFASLYSFEEYDYVSSLPICEELEKQIDEFTKTLAMKPNDQEKPEFVLSNEEIIKKVTELFGDRVSEIV